MDERVSAKDWVRLDDDKWDHAGKEYYVHSVDYRENSTATTLKLEDVDGNIFTIVVASHQIIKVT
jgi:hypothetical protein